ncbi:hypothetical protein [Maribellus mangrovi]|uniref:hypothetical protein n=1 Tax=Maribellus mangrovi TaxID=3133146 RepID=UPI0030EE3B16
MKSLMLFIASFLVVIAFSTNVEGQEKSQRAFQGWSVSTYWSPIYCDGEMVDFLEGGTLRIHYLYHYVHGKFMKQIVQIKGEVTSDTGEVFKISERDLYYPDDETITVYWKYNLRGNWGTHYIGELAADYFTGEIVWIGKSVCPNYDMDE